MCRVLRCGNPASSVINVAPPGGGFIDAAVCMHHQAQIDEGARWLYLFDDRRLLMGQDLPGRVVGVRAINHTSSDGILSLMTFVVQKPDGEVREIEFELPHEIAESLPRVTSRGRPGPK